MKVLVAFLGKGNYREVTYRIDGQEYRSSLSLWPIKEIFHPDRIYVVGTPDSRWDLLENEKCREVELRKVLIPSGRDQKELWEIIDRIGEAVEVDNSEVVFDITHCFRSIPLLVVVLIKYLKFFKQNVNIRSVYYGYLNEQTGESRIVDLAPFLELMDLIEAVHSFERFGDPEEISEIIKAKERIYKEKFPQSLRKMRKCLDQTGAVLKMTYITKINDVAEELSSLIKDSSFIDDVKSYLKPLIYTLGRFEKTADRFMLESDWQAQLELASWYNENRHPSQALLALREAIVTYGCLQKGLDPYKADDRDLVENEYNSEKKTSSKPIHKLWNKVTDYRNRTAHGLTGRDQKIDPEAAKKRVSDFIKEAREILGANHDYNN